jgi:glycosyltransferase involved in cell wall biosynthesis
MGILISIPFIPNAQQCKYDLGSTMVPKLWLYTENRRVKRTDIGLVMNHLLCLIHPIDPRGNKVGGIDTHVRMMIAHAPEHWTVLMIGVDGRGDCSLGELTRLQISGRAIEFLPVLQYPDERVHEAAQSLFASLTLQFAIGLMRHYFVIRHALRTASRATIELQRFEFALFARLLGRPTVQVIHGEGTKKDKMDSLIKKFWFIHRLNEQIAIRLADKIIGVNPNILVRLKREFPRAARRAIFLPVAVDTKVFACSEFNIDDGIFRVVFAGRLDLFKDPPLMFRTLQRIHQRLQGAFEFHYVGTSNPQRYLEYQLIENFTTCHGYCTSRDVASIMRRCHAGILTSLFEGMPCYLLELLSVGRPIVAVSLPQYALVVKDGQSGYLVERDADTARLVEVLADRMLAIWSAIRCGAIAPAAIHAEIVPFSVDAQLPRHFDIHQQLASFTPRERARARIAAPNEIR